MKLIILLGLVALCCMSCVADDLVVGSTNSANLIKKDKVEYVRFPLKKRVKEFFFADPNQQIIKAVIAREVSPTGGSVIITAGGVGFPYVNLRFKSGRGSPINYDLDIYG